MINVISIVNKEPTTAPRTPAISGSRLSPLVKKFVENLFSTNPSS